LALTFLAGSPPPRGMKAYIFISCKNNTINMKKYELDRGAYSVYALQYHFVQCVKYVEKQGNARLQIPHLPIENS